MRKRKIVLFFAVLLAAAMVISGCSEQTNTFTGTDASAKVSGKNEFPIVEEPITLRVFTASPNNMESIETNELTKFLEEKTNVKIQWDLINGDVRQAINLKLASGDYADIWYGFSFARSEQAAYHEQGVFADITDLVDEHGYHIKKMFENSPEVEEQIRHTENKILGLPKVLEDFTAYASNVMWVYEPWLQKLDIKTPETTEDFYNMLKAFKEQDPNGNGIADEIPLAGRKDRGSDTAVDNYIINAFNFSSKWGFYNKNGEATFAPIEEGYKEGLRYLRRLYSEGLLHADNFIMDRSRVMALVENDIPILGAVSGRQQEYFAVANSPTGRINEYVAIPPMAGPGGTRQTVAPYGWDFGLTSFTVTTQCTNPKAAIKWADWFYSQEAYLKSSSRGNLRLANEGEIGLDGEQAIYAIDPSETSAAVQNIYWGDFALAYAPVDWFVKRSYNNEDARMRAQGRYNAYEMYKPYAIEVAIKDFPMPLDVTEEYLELRANITSAIDSGMASFVIGERSIDDDWDGYVQNLYDLGLERYTEIYQNYVDSTKN